MSGWALLLAAYSAGLVVGVVDRLLVRIVDGA